ncbi:MAG TPA: helix-turn-helix domain-containing protein, partial [Bacteroidota bacterium]|nr:helix-turn-helix domain-containing protein [Bacteroidota bacterium]
IEKFSFLQHSYIFRLMKGLPKRPFAPIIITSTKSVSDMQREKIILGELFDLIKSYEFVTIPSLLQRQSDIPLLVDYFTKKVAESTGTRQKIVDANTMDFLVRREWKENVRELKSVVERAVFSSSSDYLELPESLIDEYAQLEGIITNIKSKQPFSFDKSLYNLEKRLIERVLDSVGNNQSKTASILKLSEANLRYRLKKFHIPTSQDKR